MMQFLQKLFLPKKSEVKLTHMLSWFVLFLLFLLWFGPSLVLAVQVKWLEYSPRYVAVYLSNGQSLYGHLRGMNSRTMKLTNIYYLQSVTVEDKATTNLIKRGTQEITSPDDYLYIDREQILFWEVVGAKSQVMNVINQQR